MASVDEYGNPPTLTARTYDPDTCLYRFDFSNGQYMHISALVVDEAPPGWEPMLPESDPIGELLDEIIGDPPVQTRRSVNELTKKKMDDYITNKLLDNLRPHNVMKALYPTTSNHISFEDAP